MAYSRFFLSDLHVHSPSDRQHHYGDLGSREPTSDAAEKLLKAHADAGVEVLAITDHNRVDWYPAMTQAGEPLGVAVFPGLEISVNGCHLLLIWERDEGGFELAQSFLTSQWKPGSSKFERNGDPKPVTSGQVLDIAKKAIDHGALILAPHCTERSLGLFGRNVCRNSREVAQSGLISAFDVVGNPRADVLTNPRSEFGSQQPRWFISGDVRRWEDVGARCTYLKLGATPSLEGLRQAFLVPDTRVRLPAQLQNKWGHVASVMFTESPLPRWKRLTRLSISGGFHDKLDTQLAPGLTALIGGKGTGKSALIEIIRYVLGHPVPKDRDLAENRKANFRANAEAVLGFVDATDEEYEVHRSGDDVSPRLVHDGDETDVPVRRRLNVRIFGQRELQQMARDADILRDFIASQTEPEWSEVQGADKRLTAELRTTAVSIESNERDLDALSELQSELADVKERLQRARERGVEKLLNDLETLERVHRGVIEAAAWPEKVVALVNEVRAVLPAPTTPAGADIAGDLDLVLSGLGAVVQEGAKRLQGQADKAVSAVAALISSWTSRYESTKQELHAKLAEAGIADARELTSAQKRALELEQLVADMPAKETQLREARTHRESLLKSTGKLRRRRSRLIESAARQLTQEVGPRVRILIDPLADRTALLAVLEGAVRGQSVRRDQLAKISGKFPSAIATAIRGGSAALEKLGTSGNATARLAELATEQIHLIEEVDTPDIVRVEINLGDPDAENWVSVENASPGQRATAMLALALASGNEPLIIDQPEDDLDNRYIFEEVVKVLASVCSRRQVIMATHNANIAVLGDAELVLALHATAHSGHVLASGGLEDPEVVRRAKEILEGGDAAFRARQLRYARAGVSE